MRAAKKKKSPKTTKSTQKKSTTAKSSAPKKIAAKERSGRTGFSGVKSLINDGIESISGQIGSLFSGTPGDIVAAIKDDHESLREFLKILKDTDAEMSVRKSAYQSFSSLLKSHTIAEENAVYKSTMELVGRELHLKVTEGFVEHQLADDLMGRIEKSREPMVWSAQANVLSEIVEHHLDEEERDLLPLIRKTATPEENAIMLKSFVKLRSKTQKRVNIKNAGVLAEVGSGTQKRANFK